MKREAVRWNDYSFLDPAEPEMYDGVMTSLEYSVLNLIQCKLFESFSC